MGRLRALCLAGGLLTGLALAPGAPAPARAATCPDGTLRCVKLTIGTFTRLLDREAASCDHDAVFTLAYLRTTQAYRRVAQEPGFFDDVTWVNREDWGFAELFLGAWHAWQRGDLADVPPAWRIAFGDAGQRRVSGAGDLLLGMNAHVNRDLPFILADVGLVAPDGSSRKPDHEKINVMLRQVMPSILDEEQARFDPTIPAQVVNLLPLTDRAFFQLLRDWREAAWYNAVRLVDARTPDARARVAASIEDSAAAQARTIEQETLYHPPATTTAARDAYCAVHGGG